MRIGLMTAVLGVTAGVGLGAETNENAALAYYRAWAIMDQDLAATLVTAGGDVALSDDAAPELEAAQGVIEDLIDAASTRGVDWEIKYEDGFAALMPHLGQMRAGAKIVGADALRCAQGNDGEGAAERAAALFRMTQHLDEDRILISSLVAMAIGNLGVGITDALIDQGVLSAEDAGIILEAIFAGDEDDRYGMRAAMLGEWQLMSAYIVSNAPDTDAGAWLFEETGIPSESDEAQKLERMQKDALLRELGGFAAYQGEVLSAWDEQDADRMNESEQRLIDGDYGSLAMIIAPSVTRAFDSHLKAKSEMEALVERLEEIAD